MFHPQAHTWALHLQIRYKPHGSVIHVTITYISLSMKQMPASENYTQFMFYNYGNMPASLATQWMGNL